MRTTVVRQEGKILMEKEKQFLLVFGYGWEIIETTNNFEVVFEGSRDACVEALTALEVKNTAKKRA